MNADPEIHFSQRGPLGVVTLDRPRAVNALTEGMVTAMLAQLRAWATDDTVRRVLVQGAGERGLCAGGDIVAIYRDISSGTAEAGEETARFWRTEYTLNALIKNYPKPYIAFMDGLVLGGGIGITAHGSVRIVTERTRCGMPETTIGFVPDVGGTYLLSRAPGQSGVHAALTGAHLFAADALYLGLADYLVPSESLLALAEALAAEDAPPGLPAGGLPAGHGATGASELEVVRGIVRRFAQPAPVSALAAAQPWIDEAYAWPEAEQIVAALRTSQEGGEQARDWAELIESKSPTAVKVTLASVRRAAGLATLEEALDQEYRVGVRMAAAPDMREGIRAQVVDKDRTPRWSPATLAEVSAETVESYFGEVLFTGGAGQ
ncbi:enoyl-CoA hydratase/isomerase family protein [Psychromicrobium xiongbiense]|uniref:enoyl-CoA hydratase/isomerase family protein n=1 Tax=Psychromicrobium xiongbiense TaxID=3051184 RepID=UPI0025563606|nr:enoyl-CoA hydratase/isomerase family protein [Psychromicrobium sp. YIM S02556]